MTLSYNIALIDLSNADPALRFDLINLIKGRGAFISVYDEYPQELCPAEEWAVSEEADGEARTETTHRSETTGEYEPSIINAWLESEQEGERTDSSRSEQTDEADNEEEDEDEEDEDEWVDEDSPAHSMELMEQIVDDLPSPGTDESQLADMEEEWVDEVDGGEYEHHVSPNETGAVGESEADNKAELQHTIDHITEVLGMPPIRPGQSASPVGEGEEEGQKTHDSPSYEELLAHINRIVDARPSPLSHTETSIDVTIPAIAPADDSATAAAPDNDNQAGLPDIEQIRAEIQREMDAVTTPGHVAFN